MKEAIDTSVFPAKLLLFGEHVLLLGASALAVPVRAFGGHWEWGGRAEQERSKLLDFAQSQALRSVPEIDTERFEKDLTAGLFFPSNIPRGYGLGSSGALCAAVYSRYAARKTEDFSKLKEIFARMESFFHGKSSGIDPLTSYTGAALLISHQTNVSLADPKPWNAHSPVVFLLDSKLPRRTGPLVDWFLEQNRQAAFAQSLREEYLPKHETLVQAWLSADSEKFWPTLRQVSKFQLEQFPPMIPATLRDFWTKSLDNEGFALKICGAGGGGFVLGFAQNAATAKLLSLKFELVFPFA